MYGSITAVLGMCPAILTLDVHVSMKYKKNSLKVLQGPPADYTSVARPPEAHKNC